MVGYELPNDSDLIFPWCKRTLQRFCPFRLRLKQIDVFYPIHHLK